MADKVSIINPHGAITDFFIKEGKFPGGPMRIENILIHQIREIDKNENASQEMKNYAESMRKILNMSFYIQGASVRV